MSSPNSQSPPRTRLRCLDQGPMVRKRDKTKKSTGGRPPRKLLSTRGQGSLIQRPSRYDLYRMKRREAILSAAKEALETEQADPSNENDVLDKENVEVVDTTGIPIEDEFKAFSLINKEIAIPTPNNVNSAGPATEGAIPNDVMQ